jgi:hypothetical protein
MRSDSHFGEPTESILINEVAPLFNDAGISLNNHARLTNDAGKSVSFGR